MRDTTDKTIKEIIDDLEVSLVEIANNVIDEKMLFHPKKNKESSMCDVHHAVDIVLTRELRKITQNFTLQPGEDIKTFIRGWDERDLKNRYIKLVYTFNNQEYELAQISFNVSTKNIAPNLFKINSVDKGNLILNDGISDYKPLYKAIEYARKVVNDKITKIREVELPKFIDEIEKKFAKIIESMRRCETIESHWYYNEIEEEYNKLRNGL